MITLMRFKAMYTIVGIDKIPAEIVGCWPWEPGFTGICTVKSGDSKPDSS